VERIQSGKGGPKLNHRTRARIYTAGHCSTGLTIFIAFNSAIKISLLSRAVKDADGEPFFLDLTDCSGEEDRISVDRDESRMIAIVGWSELTFCSWVGWTSGGEDWSSEATALCGSSCSTMPFFEVDGEPAVPGVPLLSTACLGPAGSSDSLAESVSESGTSTSCFSLLGGSGSSSSSSSSLSGITAMLSNALVFSVESLESEIVGDISSAVGDQSLISK
jgi:hypothetical protein